MKLSLRNLALTGALAVAGGAMAQLAADAPFTVEKDWNYTYAAAGNPVRDATGVNGKVYLLDKGNAKVVAVDADGATDLAINAAGCNAISADDAGNIILKIGGFGAAADQLNKFRLFNGAEGDGTDVELPAITEPAYAGRADELGRAIGNVWSEEGAVFFTTANSTGRVRPVVIQNGEPNADLCEFTNDVEIPTAANTMSTAVPSKTTVAEELEIDPLYEGGFYFRSTVAATNIYGWDGSEYVVAFVNPGTKTQHGWDVFTIGGVEYQLMADCTSNWNGGFVIADKEGNILYTHADESGVNPVNGNGSMLEARVIDENTVEIYQAWISANNVVCGKYTLKLNGGEEPAAPLYFCGADITWDPTAPVEVMPENGVYTYALPQGIAPSFKFSTSKSEVKDDWTGFNAGGFNISGGNDLAGAGEYTLEPNTDPANINLPKGNWTVAIDLAAMKMTVTGETVAFSAPEIYYRGTIDGADNWTPSDKTKFVLTDQVTDNGEYVYELVIDGGLFVNDQFKIGDTNWNDQWSNSGKVEDLNMTYEFHYKWEANTTVGVDIEPAAKLTFYLNPDTSKSSGLKLEMSTAVESIVAEQEGEATFFNLQGVRVANPAAGNLYIKVANGKAQKVLVK